MAVRFIQKRENTWRYRRKVPLNLRPIIGKTEIVIPLGSTEAEALRRYPQAHALVERQLANAAAPNPAKLIATPLDLYRAAHERVQALGLDPAWGGQGEPEDAEGIARDVLADEIIGRYRRDDEGHPLHLSPADAALLAALGAGTRDKRPAPTLEDARRQYLTDQVKDNQKRRMQLERIFALVGDVVKLDTPLPDLRRTNAREVRDHMLDGRTAASAQRYLNTLKAVLNHAIREFELGDMVNPFASLPVRDDKQQDTPDRRKRDAFTPEELAAARGSIMRGARVDLQHIWRLMEGTGCRLAEITGLRLVDVHTDHDIPHISIEGHEHRRIKTLSSWRRVPLLGDALDAAKEAVLAAGDGPGLFPAYFRGRGADSASAALGKHVRACVTRPEVTVYSLRHRIADKLDLAGVPSRERDLVLGHTRGTSSELYGGETTRLQLAQRALSAALAVKP